MTRSVDVAVVGAGPAGIGAALTAARNGASVVLVDENDAPGGRLRWTMAEQHGFGNTLDGRRGFEIAKWASSALDAGGVDVQTRSVVWGLFEDNVLAVYSDDASFQLRADKIVVATGSTDVVWPFQGWEYPGVMTATAAQRLLHLDVVLPGRIVAVVGFGHEANAVVDDLAACGSTVLRPGGVDGLFAGGSGRVEWVVVDGHRTACDAVVVALGRQPDAHFALQAQVAITYSERDSAFVPSRSRTLETSIPGIYVVGDAAGVGSPARAYAEGVVAGEAATGGEGLTQALDQLGAFDAVPSEWPAMPRIDDSTLVCRCEEVNAEVLRNAIADGATTLNDLKRRTRAAMGICQGAYCLRTMARVIADESGIPLASIAPMTARPPARLVPMAALADLET